MTCSAVMVTFPISELRRAFAAVLIIALTLTGVGRAIATTLQPADAVYAIAGLGTPICHSGAGLPAGPAEPPRHDCCDACALLAALVLSAPPVLSEPVPVDHFAEHARAVTWVPALVRQHSPRQSRGPPAA